MIGFIFKIRTPKKKAPVFEGTKTPVKKGRSSIYSQCYISPEKLLEAIPSSEANNLRMNPSEICNFCRPQKECSKQVYGYIHTILIFNVFPLIYRMHTLEAHSIHTRDSKQTIEYLNRLHAEQPNEFAKIEF